MPAGFADGVDNEGVTGIKLTRVNTSPVSVAAWTDVAPFEKEATVDCPAGSRVTGGGGATPSKLVNITSSWPLDADSWRVIVTNTDKVTPQFVIPYAICLSIEPAGAFTTAKKGLLPATVKKAMKKRDR